MIRLHRPFHEESGYLPIAQAVKVSGLDETLLHNLTYFDPHPEVGDFPPVRSVDTPQGLLVCMADVEIVARGLADSGVTPCP